MTYWRGAPASTTSANVLAALRAQIPTHSAWSLVESTTMNSGAVACDVYKCDHTVSGLSADFYAAIMAPSTVNFYFGIAEGYNTSTHKPQRPAMNATSSVQTLQTDGGVLAATTEIDWYNGTTDPGGGSIPVVGSQLTAVTWTGTLGLQLSIAKDGLGFTIDSGSTSSTFFYAGAYDSILGGTDDPLPICMLVRQRSSSAVQSNAGFATRHPRCGGLSIGYACNLNGRASGNNTSSSGGGGPIYTSTVALDFAPLAYPGSGNGDAYDLYARSDAGAGKFGIYNSYTTGDNTTGRAINGWSRGTAKYLRYTPTNSFAVGDTLTIDGVEYVLCAGDTGVWMEKDPA